MGARRKETPCESSLRNFFEEADFLLLQNIELAKTARRITDGRTIGVGKMSVPGHGYVRFEAEEDIAEAARHRANMESTIANLGHWRTFVLRNCETDPTGPRVFKEKAFRPMSD